MPACEGGHAAGALSVALARAWACDSPHQEDRIPPQPPPSLTQEEAVQAHERNLQALHPRGAGEAGQGGLVAGGISVAHAIPLALGVGGGVGVWGCEVGCAGAERRTGVQGCIHEHACTLRGDVQPQCAAGAALRQWRARQRWRASGQCKHGHARSHLFHCSHFTREEAGLGSPLRLNPWPPSSLPHGRIVQEKPHNKTCVSSRPCCSWELRRPGPRMRRHSGWRR